MTAKNQNLMCPRSGYVDPCVFAGRNAKRIAKITLPSSSSNPAIGTTARNSGFWNSTLSRRPLENRSYSKRHPYITEPNLDDAEQEYLPHAFAQAAAALPPEAVQEHGEQHLDRL